MSRSGSKRSAAFISPILACWTRSGSGSRAPRLKRRATEMANGAKAWSKRSRARLSPWSCQARTSPRSCSADSMSGVRMRRAAWPGFVNGLLIAGIDLISLRHYVTWFAIVKVISIRYQLAMTRDPRTPDRIAELLVHVGRAARSEDAGSELTAAQWTCLRFFARANGSTRTPSGFASFQATTRGTASQIIKSLERKGLVAGTRSDRDRRSISFDLTDHGRTMLAQDPLRDLIDVIDRLGATERNRFLTTLSRLASTLAIQRDAPAFGTCQDCS